jgi:hypothetical protein
LLFLQRAVGNREVSRLLQKKGKISRPGDACEREADRVAERVVMPTIQRKCACGGNAGAKSECSGCQSKRQLVQRQAQDGAAQSLPSSVMDVVQSHGGEPLPESTKDYMESALGTDLSGVRVHTSPQVARAAQDINAEAFTQGQDIYFGAGRYEPDTTSGKKLLAHELTHTIQQRSGLVGPARAGDSVSHPDDPQEREAEAVANRVVSGSANSDILQSAGGAGHINRYSWDDLEDDLASAGESVAEVAGDVGSTVASGAEVVAEGAAAVGEAVVEGAGAVVDAGGEALDWLATEAGQLAMDIAAAFGVSVRITSAGLEIVVPAFCPIDAIPFDFDLPTLEKDFMVPVFAVPIGPDIFISGEIGLTGSITPEIQLQLGPVCLNGIYILINPLTNDYSISGSLSATAAMSLGAELRGGVRGEVSLTAIVPVGPIPVPISVPLIGAEGGLAGMVRGIGAATLTVGGGLSFSGSTITMLQSQQLDLGVGADLFAGAYAELDILGEHVCRLYWQPYEWHGGIAFSLAAATDLSISPGGSPAISIGIDPPSIDQIPFDQIPLAISREGFSDDCPIKDRLCLVLQTLNLLPSQNGGVWDWTGPYGPGKRLAPDDPLGAYERNPGRASGATCRGACGPDCDTCRHLGKYAYTDPATGDVWQYDNLEDCDSHDGCRDHDAGFDWASDKKGEVGDWKVIMPWHMAANIECMCNNLGGNCIAWIAGLPPYDLKMYFADSATLVTGGGGVDVSSACEEEHPGALLCTEPNSDRDTVLEVWGAANRVGNFRDCRVVQGLTSPGLEACDGASGSIWHCTATDLPTGQDFTLSINECECCKDDGTIGSEWRQPEVVVTGGMSEELILSLCERELIARFICIPVEDDMIRRFGNGRRDLGLNPDTDPKSTRRLDDAPIFDSFRKIYNRLDSWNFFLRARHPELHPEFENKFKLTDRRNTWLTTVKAETKKFKERFRNLENQDVGPIQRDFENQVLRTVQPEMESLNLEIADWFKEKTGSSEPTDTLIEHVHEEGTELWREAWRRAILQVNRVLQRLWPPAKTKVLGFIEEQKAKHPTVDLSGPVGELDYIGSLATGFKGPPKQQVRFDPAKFDVDANLTAVPLAKYLVKIEKLEPERGHIFAKVTDIDPLKDFTAVAHKELALRAEGYDTSNPLDQFDVAIDVPELPVQERQRVATDRIYGLRDKLSEAKYSEMMEELKRENLVAINPAEGRLEVRGKLTDGEFDKLTKILDRFDETK